MRTNDFTTTGNIDDAAAATPAPPTGKPGWPAWATTALDQLTKTRKRVWRFVTTDPDGAATLVGTALGGVLTAVLTFSALAKIVQWLVHGNPVHDVAEQLPALRIATDPIGHWLATHTAGLPLTLQTAAWIWGLTGFVLFYAACHRHLGAQLLWPAYGAATAAMAWFGTDTAAHRPVAVGLLAAAWSVLSLLALRGRRRARATQLAQPLIKRR